jgi:hypothetical protein
MPAQVAEVQRAAIASASNRNSSFPIGMNRFGIARHEPIAPLPVVRFQTPLAAERGRRPK